MSEFQRSIPWQTTRILIKRSRAKKSLEHFIIIQVTCPNMSGKIIGASKDDLANKSDAGDKQPAKKDGDQ